MLILCLLQGVSAGGEFTGAQTYIVEMAPPDRRGFFGSLPALGIGLGFSTAALVVAALSATLDPAAMSEWGWRTNFLLCAPMTVACLFLRLRLEDSPKFIAMVADSEITSTPVRTVLRENFTDILRVTALTIAVLGPGFLAKLYLGIHLVQLNDFTPLGSPGTAGHVSRASRTIRLVGAVMTAIAATLRSFFTERLTSQRQASAHTIASYRDTLQLLLQFMQRRTGKSPSRLDWADVDLYGFRT